jgi:hypothetical protein
MLLASDIASETTETTLVGSFTKDKGGGESEGEGGGQGIVVESFSQGHGHVAKTMMYFC